MRFFCVYISFFFFTTLIFSQTNIDSLSSFCAQDLLRSIQQKHDHRLKMREENVDEAISEYILRQRKKRTAGKNPGQIYTIPVVVHVVHSGVPIGTDENISDAQIIKGIEHLNDAFRNRSTYNPSTGADVEIEFCLAIRNPQGNATSGINRVVSPFTNVTTNRQDDIALKNNITWDQTQYLNIWLVKEITSPTQGSGVAGYAYLAAAHGRPIDGVVNEARWFGSSADNSKVHIHEVGHYLNLYHTFEAGCPNSNCMTNGDHVCDTPPDASTSAVICNSSPNTCSTDADDPSSNNPFASLGDQIDMFNNYMDYGYQTCQDAFTNGQKERMVAALETARKSLLSSLGCQSPCTNLINLSASVDNSSPFLGQTITFSSGAKAGVTYTWDFGDGTTTSTGNTVTHTYNQIGIFTATVTAQNADPNCNESQQLTIKVSCAVNATFSSPSSNATIGTPITFTNTSTNATNYEWFIDGNSEGITTDLTHTFTAQGSYFVQLVAYNGICSDTSQSVFIRVGACNQSGVANVWNFGSGAAVDFANGAPIALTGSQMSQREGVASIADANGNLLFYTDGISVWNANNQIMLNGTGLGGAGTSAQSSIIIPAPGSTTLYYIFTVRDWTQSGAFRYSIVDMSNDGGLGSITTKNVLIQSNINEQVTGVFHQNCQDIWIISHENRGSNPNRFVAYLLTPVGLSATPVTSDIGFNYLGSNRYGGLRASHSGQKICTTLGGSSTGVTTALFDFDRSTGIVSNQQVLANNGALESAYSSEFSPNDNILYVTAYNGNFIYQYDLSAGSTANIRASRQNIASGKTTKPVLQMGPDGKIYCTNQNQSFLGVIDNPNAIGTLSNFSENAVSLGSGTGSLGLPNFLPGFFGDAISISGPTAPCKNAIEKYEINASSCINSIVWNYTGGGRIVNQDNSSITIDFSGVVGAHSLSVQAQDQCGTISSTLNINTNNNNAPIIALGNDTTLCSGTLVLDPGSGFANYEWQDGSTNQTLTASTAGTYHVSVSSAQGCVSSDTIEIDIYTSPILDLGKDSTLCFGEILALNAGSAFDSYFWQDGSGDSTFTVYQPNPQAGTFTYSLTAYDDCGNMSQDEVDITFEQCDSTVCSTSLGNDTLICHGDAIQLNVTEAVVYDWSPKPIISDPTIKNPFVKPTTDSTYIYLTTTDSTGCESSDSLLISFYDKPVISLMSSSSTEVCLGNSAQLEVTSDKTVSEWLWVGNTSPLSSTTIPNPTVLSASTADFTVIGTDTDGCKDTLITKLTVNLPPILQMSNNTTICKGESTVISVVEQPDFIKYDWQPAGSLSQSTISASCRYPYST